MDDCLFRAENNNDGKLVARILNKSDRKFKHMTPNTSLAETNSRRDTGRRSLTRLPNSAPGLLFQPRVHIVAILIVETTAYQLGALARADLGVCVRIVSWKHFAPQTQS